MSKEVQLECLDRLPWLEASNKEKKIKEAESEKEKSDLSADQYFERISLLKNPIDTRLDVLNHDLNIYNFPVLSFLKLLIFEGRN